MEKKVILAALEEVKVHGLRFTMADVTRRLRMSKSSLYKLVPSKDQLIKDMQSYIMDTFDADSARIRSSSLPLAEKVQQYVRAYLKMMQPLTTSGYFEDLQLDAIAEILDENVSTVKSRLYRGLKKLKVELMEV